MGVREFSIQGMTCVNCAMHLERMLCDLVGAGNATVNFSARVALVEGTLSDEEVLARIAEAGYAGLPSVPEPELEKIEQREIMKARHAMILSLLLAIPVFVLSMFELRFPGSEWMQLVLTTVSMLFPGRNFYLKAFLQARNLSANMDTLVAVGTGSAYVYSLYLLFAHQGHHLYFESAAVIVALVLCGRFLEERARQGASRAVRALMALQVETALLFVDDSTVRSVPAKLLRPGHRILVRRGDRIPADGKVVFGSSSVDASMLTGESRPLDLREGSIVAAGTMNLEAPIEVEVSAVGDESSLGKIIATVRRAIGSKAPIQRFADRVAAWFVPSVVVVALLTLAIWLLAGREFSEGLLAAIAVLVVSCPCALGLATPTAILVATGRAASRGILVKDAPSFEILHRARAVVFDKTGTLTTGAVAVADFSLRNSLPAGFSPSELLQLIAELERRSAHPLAKGIVSFVEAKGIGLETDRRLDGVVEEAGRGIAGDFVLSGVRRKLFIGRANQQGTENFSEGGGIDVGVTLDDLLVATFRLQDELRPEAAEAMIRLRSHGVEPVMATGDSKNEATRIATLLGIKAYSELMPEAKVDVIKGLQQGGRVVVMVGDGINDAPALASADIGIAFGSGTDVAMATAGVTLREGSIAKIVEAIELSHATFRNIKQNLFWAFAYNVLLIPVAAFGKLTPMLAAGAMACSSLLVVGNALRLRLRG